MTTRMRAATVPKPPADSGASPPPTGEAPAGRTHESFLVYRGGVHARRALYLTLGAVALYMLTDPWDGHNGGTWVGYVLGTVAALIIVLLTLFGVRKRSYRSSLGTVEGWLSAHVYLGVAVLLIATLHAGWELQMNIHGAAYILMCLVIATGLFGVYAYRRYPSLLRQRLDGGSPDQWLQEIAALDRVCVAKTDGLDEDIQNAVRSAVERTVIGGSWWRLLLGRDESRMVLPSAGKSQGVLRPNPDQRAIIGFLAERLGQSRGSRETLVLQALLDLCARRQSALALVRTDLRGRTLMTVWLRFHVPLTFALWGALIAHIVSVLVYW